MMHPKSDKSGQYDLKLMSGTDWNWLKLFYAEKQYLCQCHWFSAFITARFGKFKTAEERNLSANALRKIFDE